MVLEKIEHENDIKRINKNELPILAEEIRSFLIDKISKTGGHLASNLGVVELTMALHLAFDLPEDKIIWDVGHQSYTHKLLTGRKAGFDELRKYGGMSGFPKRHESDCDCFDTGHSSTSISAGLGYAMAREITGEKYKVISVIGDGALTGGMAYEALNNASKLKSNLIIVLNVYIGKCRRCIQIFKRTSYRRILSGIKEWYYEFPEQHSEIWRTYC